MSELRIRLAQVDAVMAACRREIDAPWDLPQSAREAWAAGYTKACEDIREAMKLATISDA